VFLSFMGLIVRELHGGAVTKGLQRRTGMPRSAMRALACATVYSP